MRAVDRAPLSSPAQAGDPVNTGGALSHRWRLLGAPLSRGMTIMGVLLALTCNALAADDLAVDVQNASEPILCAEKDNVYVKLTSPEVRRFTIEAVHPNYIGTLKADRSDFDLNNCPDLAAAPVITEKPRRVTIYETPEWQLVGLTIPNFWRKTTVPVRVGDRVETGVQLLQLWTRYQDRAEEVLVLYPQDGYWRAHPLAPDNLKWSAYGSSFMIGPIEFDQRPLVSIRDVTFDPETRTFKLTFTRGGSATLRVAKLDTERQVLDVTLDSAVNGMPFAALRSMFVTETNNDVAHLGWRAKGAPGWQRTGIMDFTRVDAFEIWAGRLVPSRHNTSAPDMVFRDFAR
jgi:hypothetical protein